MSALTVIDRDGHLHVLEAVEGWRVMEILRDHRLGLEGVCGGACECSTCHVVLADDWASRIDAPRQDELEKLDELPVLEPTSRLSCQIIWSEDLDGLTLRLADV